MDRFLETKMRWQLWRMNRRAAPRQDFKRALLARLRGEPARVGFFGLLLQPAFARLAVPVGILVLSLGVSGTYAYASSDVTVGHPLYRFKRKFEAIEEQFVRSPESRARFLGRKSDRRLAEAVELARDERQVSEEYFASALEELQRGINAVNEIPDPVRRRRAVQILLQKDGTYLVHIQEIAATNPAFMKRIAPRVALANHEALRAQVQSMQDPDARAVLRANLLAHEALLLEYLPAASDIPKASLTNY